MTDSEDRQKEKTVKMQQEAMIRLMRIMGACFAVLGCFVFFDIGGTVSALGLGSDFVKVLGGSFMAIGISDIIIAERFLTVVFELREKALRAQRAADQKE